MERPNPLLRPLFAPDLNERDAIRVRILGCWLCRVSHIEWKGSFL